MPDLAALLSEGERLLSGRHEAPRSGGIGATKEERTDRGYRVEKPQARANAAADEAPEPTKLYIYSDIGGWFGVWPEDIVAELSDIEGDVELHLHSPGGDAFDGVAIYNALLQHPGKVHGSVDGLAASAASVIAMACDDLTMRRGSQLMIHDAWGYAVGPAEDMESMRVFLDKISESIAEIYADRAGGTAKQWRAAMKAESWYRDREAVEAGLADKIETGSQAAKNQWDLKVFAHAGRDAAPTPPMPAGRRELILPRSELPAVDMEALARLAEEAQGEEAEANALNALTGARAIKRGEHVTPAQAAALMHAAAQRAKARTPDAPGNPGTPEPQTPAANGADGPSHTEGAVNMPFDRDKIREALGLGPDADDAAIQSAWTAAFTNPAPAAPAAPGSTPTSTPDALNTLAEMARRQGVVLMDPSQVDEMRQMAQRGQQAYNEQRASKRDAVIQAAVQSGRIALARVEDWRKAWDAEVVTGGDGSKTKELIESLTPNLVPMEAQGYAGSVASSEADGRYLALYPEDKPRAGGSH